MRDGHEGDEAARVVALGEGVEENEALFTGGLADAAAFARRLPPDVQRTVAIVTDGRVYGIDEL